VQLTPYSDNFIALEKMTYATVMGNPPKNPSVVKVEISMKEFLHEKEQIHRQPDMAALMRDGHSCARGLPGTGHQQRHVL
jgi:hypothetical protein